MPKSYATYRVQDPIENFHIRFRIREVTRLQRHDGEGLLNKSFVVPWQQKIYSPREIIDYLNNKNSTEGDPKDVANRKRLARLDSLDNAVAKSLDRVMLYTYIDSDEYVPETKATLLNSDNAENYISLALRPKADYLDSREERVRDRIFRDRTCKSMHICVATDVAKSGISGEHNDVKEHLLCSISLYSDGLLEISPDFSELVEETVNKKHDLDGGAEVVSGMFTSEKTATMAAKKGLIIGTHRFRSALGSEYEYTIENVNGLVSPNEIEDYEMNEKRNDFARSLKLHSIRGPEGNWMQDPPKEAFNRSIAINAEILSATGFDGDKLFIEYEIVCPPNWDLRTGNLNDGIASEDSGSEKSYSELDEEENILVGTTQIAIASDSSLLSQNSFSGGNSNNDIMMVIGSERILWGAIFFIITCLSVVVGYSYAFWLVPVFAIVLVLGTGTPGGETVETVTLSEKDYLDLSWGSLYSRQDSQAPSNFTFQSGCEPGSGLLAQPSAAFSHPIPLSFDIRDEPYDVKVAPSGLFPVILFEVYSVQSFGCNALEGYGYLTLSEDVGFRECDVLTWRPIGSRISRLREMFCGGTPLLKDHIFAEIPNKTASSLSRFGVLSEGSGTVKFRINVLKTDPLQKMAALANAKKNNESNRAVNTKRSIDDILLRKAVGGGLSKSASKSSVSNPSPLSRAKQPLPTEVKKANITEIFNRAKNRISSSSSSTAGLAMTTELNNNESASIKKSLVENLFNSDHADGRETSVSEENEPLLDRPPRQGGVKASRTLLGNVTSVEVPLKRDLTVRTEVSTADETTGLLSEEPAESVDDSKADINVPRTLSGDARARQIMREKSVTRGGEVQNGNRPELKPIKSQGKFTTPKGVLS